MASNAAVAELLNCEKCSKALGGENRVGNSRRCLDCDIRHFADMQHKLDALKGLVTTQQEKGQTQPDYLAFPEECTSDDRLGDWARDTDMPMGLSYPAVLACVSVIPGLTRMCGARVNIYGCLIVPPGGGKNETMRRAVSVTGLLPGTGGDYSKTAPGGDAQLIGLLGDRASRKKGEEGRIPGPRKLLLITHEIGDVLAKTGIDNSTLASRLCDFWDESEYDKTVGKDTIHVDCRLSWLGGLPAGADNPEKFSEFFGGQTNFGLYPRFIFGYADGKYVHSDWEAPARSTVVTPVSEEDAAEALSTFGNNDVTVVRNISPEAQRMYDAWTPTGDDAGRIKYNGKKIAILKACFNHESQVSELRMGQAIKFMQWQMRLRETFRPGTAKESNKEAWFTEHLLPALERAGARTKYVDWRRISLRNHWDLRIDPNVQLRTIEALAKIGRLVEETIDEDEAPKRGRRKQYPWVMLATVGQT
jgi:hypothetical protein